MTAVLVTASVASASASTVTIGSLAGSDPGAPCKSFPAPIFLVQTATAAISYAVPAGGGVLTSWRTKFGEAGAPLTLLLLRATATAKVYEVVGADSETLPNPIPAGGESVFTVASPIVAAAGDILGVQVPISSTAACIYPGSPGDKLSFGYAGSPVAGATLNGLEEGTGDLLNLSATLVQSVDLGLSETVTPPSGAPGIALISLTASDAGPAAIPATISDIVPNGLQVLGAGVSNGGNCTISGQAVTCHLGAVPVTGERAVADIIVSSTAPGSYSNQASISSTIADENPANNTAGATLNVIAPALPPIPQCQVLALTGAPPSVAEAVIKALHCTVGKITHATSKTVAKGLVIGTTPKAGTNAPAGTAVGIIVSSGKPKPKKKAKHKKHH